MDKHKSATKVVQYSHKSSEMQVLVVVLVHWKFLTSSVLLENCIRLHGIVGCNGLMSKNCTVCSFPCNYKE